MNQEAETTPGDNRQDKSKPKYLKIFFLVLTPGLIFICAFKHYFTYLGGYYFWGAINTFLIGAVLFFAFPFLSIIIYQTILNYKYKKMCSAKVGCSLWLLVAVLQYSVYFTLELPPALTHAKGFKQRILDDIDLDNVRKWSVEQIKISKTNSKKNGRKTSPPKKVNNDEIDSFFNAKDIPVPYIELVEFPYKDKNHVLFHWEGVYLQIFLPDSNSSKNFNYLEEIYPGILAGIKLR